MRPIGGIGSGLTLALALAGCSGGANDTNAAAPATVAPTVVVSAHRGGAAYAPENTMLAFRNAVRLGVDQLEADTQLTADGVLVLVHDDTLERTTDCSGTISAATFAALEACDAAYWFSPGQPTTVPADGAPHPLRGAGVRIPAARELLAYLSALGADAPELSIEIKDIPGESNFDAPGTQVAAALVPLIQEFGLQPKTIVQSFWPAAIDAVKRLDPTIRTQFLTTSSTGQTALQNLAYTVAGGHDISAPNFDAPDFDAQYVQLAHEAGKPVIPYTTDFAADMERIAGLGVDGLITNFPACLLALQGRATGAAVTPPELTGGLAACPAPGS